MRNNKIYKLSETQEQLFWKPRCIYKSLLKVRIKQIAKNEYIASEAF